MNNASESSELTFVELAVDRLIWGSEVLVPISKFDTVHQEWCKYIANPVVGNSLGLSTCVPIRGWFSVKAVFKDSI